MVVRRQHFIPQFHQRYFSFNSDVDRDKQEVMYVEAQDGKWFLKTERINYLMQRDYMYEVQDQDGHNLDENVIENWYREIENRVAKQVAKLATHSSSYKDINDFYHSMLPNNFADMDAILLVYVATMLIRSPLSYDYMDFDWKDELSSTGKQVLRDAYLQGIPRAKRLIENISGSSDAELLEKIIVSLKDDDTVAAQLYLHIMTKFKVTLIYASDGRFMLADNAVVVEKIDPFNYYMPLTPNIAIGLEPIQFDDMGNFKQRANVYKVELPGVEQFNKWMIRNAESKVIVNSADDLLFVSGID